MASLGAVVSLFRIKPQNPPGAGGRMALADHFRELRARLLRSLLLFLLVTIACFFIYDQLLDLITDPYYTAIDKIGPEKANSEIVISGIATGLMLNIKLCTLAGAVLSSPFWLYQIWAFILPGLHANERRWTRIFVAIAGPLFFLGVGVGYYVLPKGFEVLIGFNPEGFANLNPFDQFLSFTIRMLLVFGVSFEIPLFVILLSLAGIVTGKQLGQHRAWIVLGTFVFAAVATPSTDPFSMLFLAVPMTLLFLASEVIARIIDRRRKRATGEADAWEDDAASPL